VVSACTPRTHEPLFQQTLREAGLNPYLFEMANIRDQCSWVHQDQDALSKAKSILLASVKKAALLQRAEIQRIPVTKAALIIGAGPAGMGAALLLAEQGYKVFLVEKENELGGRARKIKYRWDKEDVQDYVKKMAQRVREHPLIELFLNSKVESFSGYVGNFRAQLSEGTSLSFGALIIATGAKEELPFGKYFYGEDARVIVQSELEELVAEGRLKAESVVMVQCVRADEVGYCSRYCCIEAVKNAIEVRKFGAEVYLLYKDMRTYGFHELYYERAREEGVNFVRTNIESLSVSLLDKKVEVRVYDEILRRELLVHADILVLSTRMVPDNAELASLLKLPLTKEGFFLEMHPKLRPIDAQDGIFLAGTCSAPMLMEEAIAQGFAAASGAAKLLSKDFVERGGIVAYIDEERCASCLFCTRVCPYGAPIIEEGRVRIEIAKCHGCGMCTSSCPAKALSLKNLESAHIDALLEGLLV
jgi:heterodisulfide reductase subunit A